MVGQIRVQPWNFEVPDVNKLIAPIERGYQDYRKREREGVEDQRQNRLLDMQEQKFGHEKRRADSQDETERLTRFGKAATAIQEMQGPQRQKAWQQLMQGHQDLAPQLQKYGVRADDHVNGPSFIARSWGEYDPLAVQAKRAQIAQTQAHADYYRAGADKFRAASNPAPQAQAAPPDPLAGFGLDEAWNLVYPAATSAGAPSSFPNVTPSQATPGRDLMQGARSLDFSNRMNLGGPRDDIDRSMLPDEGRGRPQGVQVAQAPGGGDPRYGIGAGMGNPPLMNQALMDPVKLRTFGPVGLQPPDIPGLVTAKGKTDQAATREAAGQRAYDGATPEQQQRLRDMRRDQELWTSAKGKAPSGSHWSRDGLLIDDKEGRGGSATQRAVQGALENALTGITAAREALIGETENGKRVGAGTDWLSRGASKLTGSGTFSRAERLLRPAVRSILHGMSGASVTIPETAEYLDTYMPAWNDSHDTMRFKLNHLTSTLASIRKVTAKPEDKVQMEDLQKRMQDGLRVGLGLSPQPGQPSQEFNDRRIPPTRRFDGEFGRGQPQRNNDAGDGFSWKPKGGQ